MLQIKESILKLWRCTTNNQCLLSIVMANAKDVFIICFILSCVGNAISDLPYNERNPEEMMGPSAFETIEKKIAEMVDIRVAEIVETRFAEAVETRVLQEMRGLKDEIKRELAFDMTEDCKKKS